MDTYRSGISIAVTLFKRWRYDTRIHCVFLFTGMILARYLGMFTKYGLVTDGDCTVFIFSILFQQPFSVLGCMKLVLHIIGLILLCDVPFVNQYTPYMILRGGRKAWWCGCCLYIMGTALLFVLFIALFCAVLMLPIASLADDWGSVAREMAFGTNDVEKSALLASHRLLAVPSGLIKYLYPDAVGIYTILAGWADFTILGLLMYLVSMVRRNIVLSIGAASFLVFWDAFCYWLDMDNKKFYRLFSPVSWCSVDATNIVPSPSGDEKILSIEYVCIAYSVLLLVLLAATAWKSRRWTIEMIS